MDNYNLEVCDPIGPRRIVPATTIVVCRKTGEVRKRTPAEVRFRDSQERIRPVAPFFELWVRFKGSAELQPLTIEILEEFGLRPDAVRWRVHVANLKIFRHTADRRDRIEARTPFFHDHELHELRGRCRNFVRGGHVRLGAVQYPAPTAELPELRMRFTPAAGHVYGPAGPADPNIRAGVYDTKKGAWKGYQEPPKDPSAQVLLTNPTQIFASVPAADKAVTSVGYFDDKCDGIIEARLRIGHEEFQAFARVTAGPPTFAPDSLPVRTVGDELEQALLGPQAGIATRADLDEVREIVRRALETVRLMNTAQMNKASHDRGVGMTRMDSSDGVGRALEPIFEPAVADSLAIRARHERVLLSLESGTLVWFARVLREYDETGDLTTSGRRKMPALLRGADGLYLALTRRQVSKIRAAAAYIASEEWRDSHGEENRS